MTTEVKNFAHIDLASSYGYDENPPVPHAVKVLEGSNRLNGEERFHWEVPVESLEDLTEISKVHGWEQLVVAFDEKGVTGVTVYDGYLE